MYLIDEKKNVLIPLEFIALAEVMVDWLKS